MPFFSLAAYTSVAHVRSKSKGFLEIKKEIKPLVSKI